MTETFTRSRRNFKNRSGYVLMGPLGAIEFWHHNDDHEISGVEQHSRTNKFGSFERDHCDLLGGKCWHDGTSLWASEYWVPRFKMLGEEWVWEELERTYSKWFAETEAAP
jgi:hypothetical protein